MGDIKLTKDSISITVNTKGAELNSLYDEQTNLQYMWNADPTIWNRYSPILFPFVGRLNEQKYHYDGKEYPMPTHGFARDKEFIVTEQTEDKLVFSLKSDDESLEIYPFKFELDLSYQLSGRKLSVGWTVKNTDDKKIYFSIGGHPAFMCPIIDGTKQTEYFIEFDKKDSLVTKLLNVNNGLFIDGSETVTLDNGILPIHETLFDGDTLVFTDGQIKKTSLLTPDKKTYLTLESDAPILALWTFQKKNAPYICIEPWYGMCDPQGFAGDLRDKPWVNELDAGEVFHSVYTIEI